MRSKIRISIVERKSFANGISFGDTGPYERLIGKAYFSVDPKENAQINITDIDNAEINEKGLVDFISDFIILKPVDMRNGNSNLFYDYGNRGNIRALQFFNDAVGTNLPITKAHAGNGFLFRRGYTVLFAAWQGDILPGNNRLILNVPRALDRNKTSIKGTVRSEFIVDTKGVDSVPISGFIANRGHPSTSLDSSKSTLTRRRGPHDTRQKIDSSAWKFARVETGPGLDGQNLETSIIPSPVHIYKSDGFDPGWIYELVYEASDPLILGCGYLAIRNLISYLKYEKTDSKNNKNPLQGEIKHAFCWGRSQTGRMIRDTLYLGFNSDEQNRKVFDGVMPHVSGAGRMWLNHRFAIGTSPAGQQFEAHDNPADRFPFAYSKCFDPNTNRADAILKNPQTDPFVMHTQTSTEYWQRRGSLVHTDMHGNDLNIPENVRIYFWSSSQHFSDPKNDRPKQGVCQQAQNNVRTSMLFRALLDALDDWVRNDVLPPDNEIPKRSNNTLISYEEWLTQFPQIPNVAIPTEPNTLSLYDFGANVDSSKLLKMPPKLIKKNAYPVYVPAVDCDGNEIAGVKAPMVSAPLATYTGWNMRARGFGEDYMFWFNGSTIPFSATKTDRENKKDVRLSVLERYNNEQDYIKKIKKSAMELFKKRLLLAEDLELTYKLAESWDKKRNTVKL